MRDADGILVELISFSKLRIVARYAGLLGKATACDANLHVIYMCYNVFGTINATYRD